MKMLIEQELIGCLLERYIKETTERRLSMDWFLYINVDDASINVLEIIPTIETLINLKLKSPELNLEIPENLYEDLTLNLIDSLIRLIGGGRILKMVIFLVNGQNVEKLGYSKNLKHINNLIIGVEDGLS